MHASSESRSPETSASRPTVLFVDDEVELLHALRDALRKQPFSILTAASGEQALRLLDETHVDVVVSDEQMPRMTGSDLLRAVRRKHPHTLRIILTGHATLDAAIRAINEGEVCRFLLKPCHPMDLAFTIRQALQLRDLTRESAQLLARSQKQLTLLRELEKQHPGISVVRKDDHGAIVLDENDVESLIVRIAEENRGGGP